MDFADVVRNRRSVRDYDPLKKVTDAQLKELFELVKYSPSSYNLQSWEFVVVRDPENRKRLKKLANDQQHVEDASAVIIVLGSTNPAKHADDIAADRMRIGLMDAAKKKRFDAVIKNLSADINSCRLWTMRSTSLAAMTLMLAAKSMGLATCPIESFDAARVKKEFAVPEDYEVVLLITMGYETKKQPPRPKRYDYSEMAHLEKYGKPFKS